MPASSAPSTSVHAAQLTTTSGRGALARPHATALGVGDVELRRARAGSPRRRRPRRRPPDPGRASRAAPVISNRIGAKSNDRRHDHPAGPRRPGLDRAGLRSHQAQTRRAMRPLAEQTIMITGATDGLGRALAAELAGSGATLLVHGRDEARGLATVEELRAPAGTTRSTCCAQTSRRWWRSAGSRSR